MSSQAVLATYQTSYGRIRARTVQQITRAWKATAGLTDADLEAFLRLALPITTGAQTATIRLLDGYIATLTKSKPIGIDLNDLTGLRGTDPAEVYARPVIEARSAISTGSTFEQAMGRGLVRATGLAESDVMLAQRAAASVITRTNGITSYRRVLTGASCAFCATVSTQTYKSGTLMPLHQHCDCGIAPIYDQDPGAAANKRLLDDLRKQGPKYWDQRGYGVGADGAIFTRADPLGTSIEGPDTEWRLRKPVQVSVRHHGELGPVLTPKGQHFTGPSEIP